MRMRSRIWAVCLVVVVIGIPSAMAGQPLARYVGPQACQECRQDECRRFQAYSSKAHSWKAIQKLRKGLSKQDWQGCLACHTTGYGQPGGFVSVEKTPLLKNPACEVCHGQGGRHVASQQASDIVGNPSLDTCRKCHDPRRVEEFRYRPLLHAGAH